MYLCVNDTAILSMFPQICFRLHPVPKLVMVLREQTLHFPHRLRLQHVEMTSIASDNRFVMLDPIDALGQSPGHIVSVCAHALMSISFRSCCTNEFAILEPAQRSSYA